MSKYFRPLYLYGLLLALLIYIIPFDGYAQRRSYHNDYPRASKKTINWVSRHKSEIKKYLSKPAFFISIVLPEISRYNSIRDKMETSTLEALYVRFGHSYADFSIGLFQMKPSFAELIEELSITHKLDNQLAIKAETIKLQRKERLKRLSQYRWQLQYLGAFCKIAKLKHPTHTNDLSFLATLYNTGFVDIEKVKKWQYIKAFPSGNARKPLQYAYGDVAMEFYSKAKAILK